MDVISFASAAEYGRLGSVRKALKANPELANSRVISTDCPLHLAAKNGQLDVVKLLLDYKADVNAIGSSGQTPLHYATQSSQLDVVKSLLAAGADLNIVDERQLSPLGTAARKYYKPGLPAEEQIFNILKDAGALYDLTAAAFMCDLERMNVILGQSKTAAQELSQSEFILQGIARSEWGTLEVREQIIDMLYQHGFRPPKTEVDEIVTNYRMCRVPEQMLDCLRNFSKRLTT